MTLHLGKHCYPSPTSLVSFMEWLVWNSALLKAEGDSVLLTSVPPVSGTGLES